jgi:hypothetical protein
MTGKVTAWARRKGDMEEANDGERWCQVSNGQYVKRCLRCN